VEHIPDILRMNTVKDITFFKKIEKFHALGYPKTKYLSPEIGFYQASAVERINTEAPKVGPAPGGPDNPTANWSGKIEEIVVILQVWF
jgi:hypothetical protein